MSEPEDQIYERVMARVERVLASQVERFVERRIAAMRAEGLRGLTDEFIAAVLLPREQVRQEVRDDRKGKR